MPDIYLRSVPADTNSVDVRLYDPTLADSAGGIVGTLTAALGAATLSAAGTVAIAATASNTLGAATLSATGTVASGEIVGTLSVPLGAATLVSTGYQTRPLPTYTYTPGVRPRRALRKANLAGSTLRASPYRMR